MENLQTALQAAMPKSNQEKSSEASGPIAKNTYSHIVLTDEEISEALRIARRDKDTAIRRAEYWKRTNSEKKYPSFDAGTLKEYILQKWSQNNTDEFIIDNSNKEIIELLCWYFTGDNRFEEAGYNLDKGILISGGVGVGKTTLMKLFFQNQVNSFAVVPCRKISDMYQDAGFKGNDEVDGIAKYSALLKVAAGSNPFGHREVGYCFDDLGTETIPAKHYGQDKNVMAETILNRYDSGLPFKATHITTNLSASEIKAVYGVRVADRMAEMFNEISFNPNSKSRR